MPAYDSTAFNPPAPVALVSVHSPLTETVASNVPMLLDTGADISLLPQSSLSGLMEISPGAPRYEIEGFDGTRSFAPAVEASLMFLGKSFRGQFLVLEGTHGILGRNVLNEISLTLDGPAAQWRENR